MASLDDLSLPDLKALKSGNLDSVSIEGLQMLKQMQSGAEPEQAEQQGFGLQEVPAFGMQSETQDIQEGQQPQFQQAQPDQSFGGQFSFSKMFDMALASPRQAEAIAAGAFETGAVIGEDPGGALLGAGQGTIRRQGIGPETQAQQMTRGLFEEAGPVAGQIVGSAAGLASGVPGGAFAGGAVGSAAGEAGQQALAGAFGGRTPETLEESVIEIEKAAIEGFIAEIIPAAAQKLAGGAASLIGRTQGVPPAITRRALFRPDTAARNVGQKQRKGIQNSIVSGVRKIQQIAEKARRNAGKAVENAKREFIANTENKEVVDLAKARAARTKLLDKPDISADRISGDVKSQVAKILDGGTPASKKTGKVLGPRGEQIIEEVAAVSKDKLTAKEALVAIKKLDDLTTFTDKGLRVVQNDADEKLISSVRKGLSDAVEDAAIASESTSMLTSNANFIKTAVLFDELGLQLGTNNMSKDALLKVGKRLGSKLGEDGAVVATAQKQASQLGAGAEMTVLLDDLTRAFLSGDPKFTPSSIDLTLIRGQLAPATVAALAKGGPRARALLRLLTAPALSGADAGKVVEPQLNKQFIATKEDSDRFFTGQLPQQ